MIYFRGNDASNSIRDKVATESLDVTGRLQYCSII